MSLGQGIRRSRDSIRNVLRDSGAFDSYSPTGGYINDGYGPAVKSMKRSFKRSRQNLRSKKSRRGNRRTMRYRSILNTPFQLVRRLQTVFRCDINPAASSAVTALTFALNGATDPTLATSAQKPLFFNQYMTLYQQYTVLGYKILVEAVSSDNTNPIVLGFTPKTDSTTLTDPSYYIENKGTVHRMVTQDIDKVVFGAKGSIKKWLRPSGGTLTNDVTYSGTASANPTTILYGHLWAAAVNGASTDPSTVNLIVRIEQVVRFFNPITPARST